MSPPVLVVGSYPPIPVAGAPVTVQEVRRAWAAGDEVFVAAPRLSAAHLAVPVSGPLAARRLGMARRLSGADRLVLVVEPGYPFAGPLWRRVATAVSLGMGLRAFGAVRLVVVGPVPLPTAWWARFVSGLDDIAVGEPGPAAAGVTPVGPPELPLSARPRQVAGMVVRPVRRRVRRLLGRRGSG